MASMQRVAHIRKVDLIILILPTKGEVYRWILEQRSPKPEDAESSGFAQAILGICKRLNMTCLDTKPYLVKEAWRQYQSSGRLLWWRDDTHFGEGAHEAVAAFIAKEVLGMGKSGCR